MCIFVPDYLSPQESTSLSGSIQGDGLLQACQKLFMPLVSGSNAHGAGNLPSGGFRWYRNHAGISCGGRVSRGVLGLDARHLPASTNIKKTLSQSLHDLIPTRRLHSRSHVRSTKLVRKEESPRGHVIRASIVEALAQHDIGSDLVGNLLHDLSATSTLVDIDNPHFD